MLFARGRSGNLNGGEASGVDGQVSSAVSVRLRMKQRGEIPGMRATAVIRGDSGASLRSVQQDGFVYVAQIVARPLLMSVRTSMYVEFAAMLSPPVRGHVLHAEIWRSSVEDAVLKVYEVMITRNRARRPRRDAVLVHATAKTVRGK